MRLWRMSGVAAAILACAGLALAAKAPVKPAATLSKHAGAATHDAGDPDEHPLKKDETGKFAFRFFGPEHGNRVASVAGIPGNHTTYYAGAAAGGLWKSDDGGNVFKPIFEEKGAAAIGAIAIAPAKSSTVWIGTGEPWAIRDIDIGGNGVYKSEDAGKSFQHMGLDKTGRIARIVIDPKHSNIVYVCAEGRLTGPQEERGVFVTRDGGKSWTRSLFVNPGTGCSGLAMDPHDSRTLIAGTWQVAMHVWGEFSGGPGSGLFITHDAGKSWTRLTGEGLPRKPVGKIDVAFAPSKPGRVYALIEAPGQGAFWRSDDGARHWRVMSWDRTLIGRAGYYIRLAVSPKDADKIYVASSSFHVSSDGGKTWPSKPWGGDNHDIWMDPTDPSHFAITYDGGFAVTATAGKGWHETVLPVGEMYHVAVDDRIPYNIYSNMQDDSTMRGPIVPRGQTAWGIGRDQGWEYGLGGCESGFTLPDPADPDIVWASCYADEVTRYDAKTHMAHSVSPWFHTMDSAPDQTKYRCHWTAPMAIDPFDHNLVYYGCQSIFATSDGGQSWRTISPDLSANDPKYLVSSGGLIGDNLGQFYGEVVFAIAPSTAQQGLIWAGTNDSKVWYTPDRGAHWNDVTAAMGLKPWGVVTSIQPSFFKAGTAYVTVDYHLSDDRKPYIYKTEDFGKTWTVISGGLPQTGELSYARSLAEDPNAEGLLFAGTGDGLYYSLDAGTQWTALSEGLPPSPVTWAVVQKRFHDLVISTWGRGLYVLDDISPLEQMARAPSDAPVRLFTPRDTYRFVQAPHVAIDFALKAAPKAEVRIAIADSTGKTIRTLTKTAHAGMNRVSWDMLYQDLTPVVLRTVPDEDPHIWEEARFKGKTFRPVTHWGMGALVHGPMAIPGTYQITLMVDGTSVSAPLTILPDPASHADAAGLKANFDLQQRLAGDIARVAGMVNLSEQMRAQLAEMAKTAALAAGAKAMDEKIQRVEYELMSKALAPSDDKYYVTAWKVYYNLVWLYAEVGGGAGDVAGGNDFAPTDTAPKLLSILEPELEKGAGDFEALMAGDVAQFNASLAARHLPLLETKAEAVPDLRKAYGRAALEAAAD